MARSPAVARLAVDVIGFCLAHARLVVIAGLALGVLCGAFAALNFKLNSNIDALLPSNVEWRKNELAFEAAFHRFNVIEAVVGAPTPELASLASSDLARNLADDKSRFQSASGPDIADFFRRRALFFLPVDALRQTAAGLVEGEPIIHDIAGDRTLRGLVAGLEDALLGLQSNRLKLDDFARPLDAFSQTLEDALAGRPASFSWRDLAAGKPSAPADRRGYVEIRPILDFHSLQPGLAAETAIRDATAPIALSRQAQARLTGPVAIDDEQFGTIRENAFRNGAITVAAVVIILWLALRSVRLIGALVVNLIVGLAATAAWGLLAVGAFNVISIYFAVLFVGIGVDFAIQFSVRYREERHRIGDLPAALRSAGARVAMPLALASLATAAGFFSFLPTDYRGVSELGLIAGGGMLIAFVSSVTLLPALIKLLNPPGEPSELGYRSLAPVDDYLARRRVPIIVGTLAAIALASPLLLRLSFDDNPIDLQNPNHEAVATYLDLIQDPATGVAAVEALAPSLQQANADVEKFAHLPEVASVKTLSSFIPADQDAKLPIIRAAAGKLTDAFSPDDAAAAPSDAETIDALNEGASRLNLSAGQSQGSGASAMRRLSAAMTKVAQGSPELRMRVADALLTPLNLDLDDLHQSLEAEPVTLDNLPRELVDGWVASDGQARVSILPKADARDTRAMQVFARAVLAVDPAVTEGPVATLQAGDMIQHAFIVAGLCALVSIAALLWLFLRRLSDVALTLFPLALAGLLTMELMSAFGMPFNFANIIALPLLLGVGVAFKIYYIVAWREGATHLLQTPLTRAVVYSALTTAAAFGSLWFSSHPGTSSMGKLLALSLACTLAAAVLFQPILMGKPRTIQPSS
ncbi:MAG: hopanoid biosynthesis-associated RND transporter HpnN [Bradyrhizobium sp.]|nr:MAG: hopanoid biosynthesis-associated RND transporter HpnN [Bradyrhizobium sp.]